MNETGKHKKKFELYTEKITGSSTHKAKNRIILLFVVISCIVFSVLVLPRIIWGISHIIDAAKSEISINEDDNEASSIEISEAASSSDAVSLDELTEVSKKINKSLVKVAVKESFLQAESDGNHKSGTGVIIGETNSRYVILTSNKVVKKGEGHVAVFSKEAVDAYYLAENATTGLAMVSVKKADLSVLLKNDIEVARIKDAGNLTGGEVVYATGEFNDLRSGFDYGIISEVSDTSVCDNFVTNITTNIKTSGESFGFLFDSSQNLIGVCTDNLKEKDTFAAASVMDYKWMLEGLSSGENEAYLGIFPKEAHTGMKRLYSLPDGVFVEKVAFDSPAYLNGVQPGDIIYQIDDKKIVKAADYVKVLHNYEAGNRIRLYIKRIGKNGYLDLVFTVTLSDDNEH